MDTIKGTVLAVNEEVEGIEKSESDKIKATFDPMYKTLKQMETEFDVIDAKEITPEVAKEARELRLRIVKVRTSADKLKTEKKKKYLIAGNAIQAVYNLFKNATIVTEEKLEKIENFQKIKDEEARELLKSERVSILAKFGIDGNSLNLGEMLQDVWDNFLTGAKSGYEAKIAAEKKAEDDRQAAERKTIQYNIRRETLLPYSEFLEPGALTGETTEEDYLSLLKNCRTAKEEKEAEAERIRFENQRLKAEQKEARLKAEKEQQEREAKEEADRLERERIEAKRLENERIEREAREAKEEADRKERDRIEAERLEAEKQERLARERKAEEERILREEEQARKDEELRIEREKRETAEREAQEAEEARQREAQEKEEARLEEVRKSQAAPDKEKLIASVEFLFSQDLKSVQAGSAMNKAINILKECIEEM